MSYTLPHTLTYIETFNRVYNWFSGEYIEFEDLEHPFLNIIKNNKKNFEKFKYKESYEDFEWLVEKRFIVKNTNIISELIKSDIEKRNNNSEISLILLPVNNACNFNCIYCYEDHNLKKYMGGQELEIILKFIENKKVNKVSIEWFGGEPLLNKNFILNFYRRLKNKKNIEFKSAMTTNGYLLDINIFKKFINLGLNNFQITIDGLEEDHNKFRPLVGDDSGSYKKIINNLIEISSLPNSFKFNILIRVNFNKQSATKNKRKKVLTMLKKFFGNDRRFGFIFRPIGNYAELNNKNVDDSILCFNNSQNSIQKQYEQEALNIGLKIAEFSMYIGNGSAVCYAGKKNHFIIDSNMQVKKCTVALDDPINLVGYIDKNGNFIENENYALWIEDNFQTKAECYSCFFISQCQSNNCRLKNIKNFKPVCPSEIIENEKLIANQIIEYIQEF